MSIAAQIDTITQTSPKKVHRYRVGKYLGEKLKKTLVRKYVSIIVLFARYAPGRRKLDKFRSFSVGYHFKAIKPDVAVPEGSNMVLLVHRRQEPHCTATSHDCWGGRRAPHAALPHVREPFLRPFLGAFLGAFSPTKPHTKYVLW